MSSEENLPQNPLNPPFETSSPKIAAETLVNDILGPEISQVLDQYAAANEESTSKKERPTAESTTKSEDTKTRNENKIDGKRSSEYDTGAIEGSASSDEFERGTTSHRSNNGEQGIEIQPEKTRPIATNATPQYIEQFGTLDNGSVSDDQNTGYPNRRHFQKSQSSLKRAFQLSSIISAGREAKKAKITNFKQNVRKPTARKRIVHTPCKENVELPDGLIIQQVRKFNAPGTIFSTSVLLSGAMLGYAIML